MAFQINTAKYSGQINAIPVGTQKVMLGGQSAYAFHSFEGAQPHKPKIALDVWDCNPGEEWNPALLEAYKGVLDDPGAWAKKCVEYGADIICLHLKSSDPNEQNTGAAEAVAAVGKVVAAVDVPIIVMGVEDKEKDVETLAAVAEKYAGKNLILGPVTEATYKQIGAQALAYGHTIFARSPIDVNLAKQLNILLGGLGLTNDKIIIDPTPGGLGYGMEYTYSVMERMQMAALVQQDDNLQQPIISFIGEDTWKCKEAGLPVEEHPNMGVATCRGVLMECTQAVSMLMAGGDLLVMNHPEAVKMVRKYIDVLSDGGEVKSDGLPAIPMVDAAKLVK